MTKPLICDLPYPNVDNLSPDVRSAKIISFAYSSLYGELSAILQYHYHNFWIEDPQIALLYEQIAIAEMMHFEMLGKAMKQLGVDPLYRQKPQEPNLWYNTSSISYSKTLPKMLLDDIQGEMNAIADYKKMLMVLNNEQVESLIQRIILDEELHLERLSQEYNKFCENN